MAKLHTIKAPDYLPKSVSYGITHFNEVKIYAPESSFFLWLKNTQKYIKSSIHDNLPEALIHSDVFYSNIIVNTNNQSATIMDFEEACYYYRIFDIGMMIVGTCSDGETINFTKVRYLLNGYQQRTPLLEIEKKSLQAFTTYAATATAFWRHKNFNYVNIDPEMKTHYLPMKILADYIMRIPHKQYLEKLNIQLL